jgi:glycosyltransferase involved in cell wall biosynthesis
MAKRDNDVWVFTSSSDHKNIIEIDNSMKIHRYGITSRLMSSSLSLNMLIKPREYDLDIVHASFDIPPAPFAALTYLYKKKTPLVVTYHGDWDEGYGSIIRKAGVAFNNKFLVDRLLSKAMAIICPSGIYARQSHFLAEYQSKVKIIPNGVNWDAFNMAPSKEACRLRLGIPLDKKIILFVGNLSFYKAPDILLRAFRIILNDSPDALLVMAGEGDMAPELKQLTKELDLQNNVIFAGLINAAQKPFYYRMADVFCLPSRIECYPLTILEAMSAGTPVVSTTVGGIPDIIQNGLNGSMVEPDDPGLLANSLHMILDDEVLAKKFTTHGKEKALSCSWPMITDMTEELYRSIA